VYAISKVVEDLGATFLEGLLKNKDMANQLEGEKGG
jgi:hypothetical protein